MKTGFIYPLFEPDTPVNLLDNSDFRNPVNQRRSGDINTRYQYPIDRWMYDEYGETGSSAGYDATNKYLYIVNQSNTWAALYQSVEASKLRAGTYTLAFHEKLIAPIDILVNSDNTTIYPRTTRNPVNGLVVVSFDLPSVPAEKLLIAVYANTGHTVAFDWAVLYEGSYTADALPFYIPKGYAAELAECQRFFEVIGKWTEDPKGDLDITINYHKKRIAPTSTIYSNHGTAGYISGYSSGAWSDKTVIMEDLSDTTVRIMSYNGNVVYGFNRIEISADL